MTMEGISGVSAANDVTGLGVNVITAINTIVKKQLKNLFFLIIKPPLIYDYYITKNSKVNSNY